MKALGIIILAAVVGFLGYQVAYPKIFDPTFFPKDPTQFTETKTKSPVAPETPKVAADVKKEEPKAEEPMAKAEPKADPKSEPKTETPPAMVATGGMGEATKKEDAPEDPNVFHPPVFPPLEEVVKGWKEIPKKAFPRPVVLHKGVEFVMSIGKSKVGPGGTATAVDQEGDMLVVAPAADSPAHSQIALDDTNLKETLSQAYETWKVQMTAWKKRQFEFRQHAAERKASEPPSKAGPVVASNDKPKRDGDGTYPVLMASMKSGQVTEITPTNIKKISEPAQEKIDGKNYWTIIVNYTTKTMFGDFDTEAQARILNGKVEKWVYTGSGEVVP